MKTGFRGTFVISWSQTEIDGIPAADLDMLAVGASWRWTGEPVRMDGPQTVLVLEDAVGSAEMRRRAAKMVRRLVGAAVGVQTERLEQPEEDAPDDPERGFIVTDGHHSYAVTYIAVPDSGARLLLFVGEMPPADCDMWVVRSSIDRTQTSVGAESAGGVICFTPDTRILTPEGPRLIQMLRPGDLIQTKDNGAQEILWVGSKRMTGARLYAMPHLRPIRFREGALGQGRPDGDLVVSPQHRMLIAGPRARSLFNAEEVLARAEDLTNDHSILVDHALTSVTYIHLLLERHNIVFANGVETESFHPSNTALDMIEDRQRAALLHLMPEIEADPQSYGDYARRNLSVSEAAILRHSMAV